MRAASFALILAMAVSAAGHAAERDKAAPRWDGADELPTDVLACAAGGPAAATAKSERAPKPMAYDGGVVAGMSDLKGKEIGIIDVPVQTGTAYFKTIERGMKDAAKELGNVQVKTEGSDDGNLDDQIKTLDAATVKTANAILFSAGNLGAVAPPLKKALARGKHVVGYDRDTLPAAREWFVARPSANTVAKAMLDALAKEKGEQATFAIVTTIYTARDEGRLVAEMNAYQVKCHPKMKWLETVEASHDDALAFNQANALVGKYGEKMQAIFGVAALATPAAAEAVSKANGCGKIAVIGLSDPNPMKPYVAADCVKSVVYWNPIEMGYAAVRIVRAVADGKLKPGDKEVDAGKLGKLKIANGSEIPLPNPYVFTKENIGLFDF